MPDIGLGELIVIAALALLVFGDRLPKVAADAARTLRQVRQMASSARRELSDAAGLEKDPELAAAVSDLRDLDPRRILEPLDEPTMSDGAARADSASPGSGRSGSGGSGSGASRAPSPGAGAHGTSTAAAGQGTSSGSLPVAGPGTLSGSLAGAVPPDPVQGTGDGASPSAPGTPGLAEPGPTRPAVDPDWT